MKLWICNFFKEEECGRTHKLTCITYTKSPSSSKDALATSILYLLNFFLQRHYVFPGHLCHKGLWQQFNTLLILNFLAKYFSLIYFSLTLMKDFFTIPNSNAMRMLHFTRTPGAFMLHYISTEYPQGSINAVF